MSGPHAPGQANPVQADGVRGALDGGLRALADLGGDLVGHANRIGAILWSPPRVVIVGRVNAGKSTLVNALIGAPIAETAALEATNVVTVYQDGAPSRAEAVGLDGARRAVPLTAGRTVDLGAEAAEIAYVHRFLPSQAIADLTLIDTPGLATLTVANEDATRRVLIDGYEQTRSASVDADAAVFLFDSAPRADEMAFLHQLGFTPLNTLGVLSRADSFGAGALGQRDPIGHAIEHARALAGELSATVATVIPVAGLLAQTSHTGQLTEADARALHSLAPLDVFDLMEVLEADDPEPRMTAAQRDRLLDLVGEYGALNARGIAGGGAHALGAWLTEHSGIGPLRQVLHTALRDFALLHRAGRILEELDTLAFSHPARQEVRAITDWVRANPAMGAVLLFRTLRGMLITDPSSPVVPELARVLGGRNPAERLGLHPQASAEQVRAAATERLGWASRRAISTTSAAEDAALVELARTYTMMRSTR